MKKQLSIIANIISGIIILDSFNAAHSFAYFLIAGQVPGTNIVISGSAMLVLMTLIFGFIIGRISLRVINLVGQPKLTRQQA